MYRISLAGNGKIGKMGKKYEQKNRGRDRLDMSWE